MGLGAKVKNALSSDHHHSSTRTADHTPGSFHNNNTRASSVPRTTATKDFAPGTGAKSAASTSPTSNYTHSTNSNLSDLGHNYYLTTNPDGSRTHNTTGGVDSDLNGYRAEEYDSPGTLTPTNASGLPNSRTAKTNGVDATHTSSQAPSAPYWGSMDAANKSLPLRPKDQSGFDSHHHTAATGTTALTGSRHSPGNSINHSNAGSLDPSLAASQGTALQGHLQDLTNYGVEEGRAHETLPGQHHAARHQGTHISDSTHAATTGAGLVNGAHTTTTGAGLVNAGHHPKPHSGMLTPPKTASPTGGNAFGPGHRGAKVVHTCSRCGADEDISRYFEGDSVYRLA